MDGKIVYKRKRIQKPNHINQILAECINELRLLKNDHKLTLEEKVSINKTIGSLSNIALKSISLGQLEERMSEIEKLLKE